MSWSPRCSSSWCRRSSIVLIALIGSLWLHSPNLTFLHLTFALLLNQNQGFFFLRFLPLWIQTLTNPLFCTHMQARERERESERERASERARVLGFGAPATKSGRSSLLCFSALPERLLTFRHSVQLNARTTLKLNENWIFFPNILKLKFLIWKKWKN